MDESKRCTKCLETKPRAEFNARSRSKDGLTVWCKPCISTYAKEHYGRTKAKRLAQSAAWYEANRDRKLKTTRRWMVVNAARNAENRRAYREANPGWSRESTRRWRERNPERVLELSQERRAREVGTRIGRIDWRALWTGVCGICGDSIDESLRFPDLMRKSADHIIPLARGGTHTQDNLQWAHLICNARKGARMDEAVA